MGCTYGDWRPLANAKIKLFRKSLDKSSEIEMFKALMPMYENIFLSCIDVDAIEKSKAALLENVRESTVRYVLSAHDDTLPDLEGLNKYVSDSLKGYWQLSDINPKAVLI